MAADPPNYFVPLNRNRRCRLNWSRLDYAIERERERGEGGSIFLYPTVLISIAITPTIVRLQCRSKDSLVCLRNFHFMCSIFYPGGELYEIYCVIFPKTTHLLRNTLTRLTFTSGFSGISLRESLCDLCSKI